jgi:hypothetical protein
MVKSSNTDMFSSLESSLDQYLGKDSPIKLPTNVIKIIVQFLPWLALLAGIGYLSYAWTTYRFGGGLGLVTSVLWVGIAALNFLAFPLLQNNKKAGWNYLFYSSIGAIIGFLLYEATFSYGNIFSGIITGVISAFIQWYFLFQIKSSYNK